MTELKKRDVEQLMSRYDDDPVGALTTALRTTLDQPDLGWTELVNAAGFSCARRIRLQAQETAALDELLEQLNEARTITPER